jgi:ATP-dependent helicase/nuclease subunit B
VKRFRKEKGRALLLVPTKSYAERLQQLIKQDDAIELNGIMPFIEMFATIVGEDARAHLVGQTAKHLALTDIFSQEISPNDFFGKMQGIPGFIRVLAEFIRELKLSGISPDLLEAGVEATLNRIEDPRFRQEMQEVITLYRCYEQFLQTHNLWDEEDLPRLAAEKLNMEAEFPIDIRCILVDGFYRFPQVWRNVLAAFVRRGMEVIVTLPYEESRPLLFAATARTLAQFREEFCLEEVQLPSPSPDGRHHVLLALERGIFGDKTNIRPHVASISPSALTIFDAPNPYTEAEMVARALLQEHLACGIPWNRCAIIARSPDDYADILTAVCERYGIPLAINRTRIVADHPLIRALITLLHVFLYNWQREHVIAFLKSSYITADKLAADRLCRQASRRGLREGREGWRKIVTDLQDANDPLTPTLKMMLAWDEELHQPFVPPDTLLESFERLLTDFHLLDPREHADRAALKQAREVLAEIALTNRLTGREPTSPAEFWQQVINGWQMATYVPPLPRDAVTLIEPLDTGARNLAFVIVMGLTERVFPRQVKEDPFLRDDERAVLREVGLPLETHGERTDEERLLFYRAITAPSQRLVLSYPRAEEEADTLRSFYIDEVLDLFEQVPTVSRLLTDVTPRLEECVSSRDRILAACAKIADEQGETLTRNVESDLSWLDEAEYAAVEKIVQTRYRPRLARLESEELRRCFATPRRYHVSEIETYLQCPFHYLAKYGLKLRGTHQGAGPLDRGKIHHAVLRRHFRMRTTHRAIPNAEEMYEALLEQLQECLRARPLDAQPYRIRMMERALLDALHGFARREEMFRALFHLFPAYFELRFGLEEDPAEVEDEMEYGTHEECDPASTARPLLVSASEGGPPIEICGVMDRVDVAADGTTAMVMDYKTGHSVPFEAIRDGKSLQMPVYLMALEQIWGLTGAVGCYDSPRDSGRRRFYRQDIVDIQRFRPTPVENGSLAKPVGPDKWAEITQRAQERIRAFVAQIKQANVMPMPGEYCNYCLYADICRTSRDNVHDGEPIPLSAPGDSGG